MMELSACMSPNAMTALFMPGELGLPNMLRHVRVWRGEHFEQGFEALHANRKLPVLVDCEGPDGAPLPVLIQSHCKSGSGRSWEH